jgi:hypothetical protein
MINVIFQKIAPHANPFLLHLLILPSNILHDNLLVMRLTVAFGCAGRPKRDTVHGRENNIAFYTLCLPSVTLEIL